MKRLNGSGIWRFRPETMELDVVARGMVNPWGNDFDRWGQEFATDGAGSEGIQYIFDGAAYLSAVGVPRLLTGMNPGSPKFLRHGNHRWQPVTRRVAGKHYYE
ncbi:MAG: hypothetical protein R3C11_25950 [Planctomycetaceae bacterium]